MRRFFYDSMLLFIILIIGLSLSQSNTMSLQEDLIQYEDKIEHEIIDENKYVSINNMKENQAATLAKGVSNIIRVTLTSGVKLIYIVFENILNY